MGLRSCRVWTALVRIQEVFMESPVQIPWRKVGFEEASGRL
jgi:hypothetical protein